MLDFENDFSHLKSIPIEPTQQELQSFLIEEEQVIACFGAVRDKILFTNKRIFAVSVKGMAVSKTEYISIPYSKVQSYAIETAAGLDLDCDMVLIVSGMAPIKFQFLAMGFDLPAFVRTISRYIL